jgi:ABC-type transport system substrate-binding protein
LNARRSSLACVVLLALTVALAPPMSAPAAAAPEGQITIAVHVSLAPTWFDPAETPGVITPFMTLYALHDALVKPMPGNAWAPSLAESWTASKDGLTYEFALRKGVSFHNGDAVSAEDVKFSFERYKGSGATTLKARVAAVEIVDAHRVRFRMKQPWPRKGFSDALFRDQTVEMDKKRRETLLHKIQQLMHERAMFAPIVEPALLTGVGSRMAEAPTITGHPYISPYEDIKLKGR